MQSRLPFFRSILLMALVAMVAMVMGCGGPLLIFPGGALSGTTVTKPVADWSFVDETFLELETRPSDPYSVQLNYVVREGKLYIDPAEGKRWLDHLREDPRVRVRFGSDLYDLEAVLVGQPGQLEDFDSSRFIYRLDPRSK